MTKKYFWAMAVIAAFVAGTMMTGTMVDAAKPNNDGDGDGDMEGAIHEIIDLLNHEIFGLEEIKTEVANIETDVSAISDIKDATDKIQMLKDQVAAIKTQLDNSPEPLSQLKILTISSESTNNDVDISSTGPLIVDVCAKLVDGDGGAVTSVGVQNPDAGPSPGLNSPAVFFQAGGSSPATVTECVTMVAETSQTISVQVSVPTGGTVFGYINVHSTPSATITITP